MAAPSELSPFHLAIPVRDLEATRSFYCNHLGCSIGREAPRWIDFNFFGHQVSVHLVESEEEGSVATNAVDGDRVPSRHFGVVLPWAEWQALKVRLEESGQAFLIAPKIRFQGEPGEQGTFFLHDPSANALEFKSFRDPSKLFASS